MSSDQFDPLIAAIAKHREDKEFMARLASRLESDTPLLQRMSERRAQTWDLLAEALGEIRYGRDEPNGRRFHLVRDDEHNYAALYIFTRTPNTYRPDETRYTRHEFVVPVAMYHKAAWTRWVFDQIVKIETHETAEWFMIPGPDGQLIRPYAPHHGNGWDPYTLWYDGHPDEQAKAPGET